MKTGVALNNPVSSLDRKTVMKAQKYLHYKQGKKD
jgi:hypothetical protein